MNVSTAQKLVHNEDRIFSYSVSDGKHAFYDILVVCDGHGGDEAVTAVITHIRDVAEKELATRPTDMATSLRSIFDHLQARVDGLLSGTTCTLCIVVDKTTVWCANVGDSHALLVEPLSVQTHAFSRSYSAKKAHPPDSIASSIESCS
jgi:serine/threonine protein phosphatase PrpC